MTSLWRCLGSGSATYVSQWPKVWPLCAGVLDPAARPTYPNDLQYDLSVQVPWIRQRDLRIPMTYKLSVQVSLIRQRQLRIPVTYYLSVQVSLIRQRQLRIPVTYYLSVQVSWIRQRDLRILTIGSITYTADQRFSSHHTDDFSRWVSLKHRQKVNLCLKPK